MILSPKARWVVVLVSFAVAVLGGCARDSAGPERDIDLEWVAQDDASILGETATISGALTEVLGPHAIVLGGENAEGNVIVVSGARTFADLGLAADAARAPEVLRVTGTVRELDVVGFEDEFGIDYRQELSEELDGEHVIVAEEVAPVEVE